MIGTGEPKRDGEPLIFGCGTGNQFGLETSPPGTFGTGTIGFRDREPLDYRDREPLDYRDGEPRPMGVLGQSTPVGLWKRWARAPPLWKALPEPSRTGREPSDLGTRTEFGISGREPAGRRSIIAPVQPQTLAVTQPLPLSPFSSVSYDRLRCSRQRRSAWSSALARVGGVLEPRLLGTMPMLPRQSHSEPTLCGELRRLDITAVPGLGNRVSALDWRRSDRRRARDC